MKEKIKRGITLLLTGALMLSCASCKKEDKVEEIPTLKWYLPGETQADQASVDEKINEILIEKAGCKLEFAYLDAGVYTEKMQMMMASRDPYDLCFTGYVNPYVKAARTGGLLAIDEYLKASPALIESLPEYALQAAKVDGKIYGIPNMQVMANSVGLFLLEDLVNEYGKLNIEEIKDVEDIEPFLQWVKETHPEKYPFKSGQPGGNRFQSNGVELVGEICKGVIVVNDNGEIKATVSIKNEERLFESRLVEDWFKKGYIRSDVALVTDDSSDEKANKYAAWRGVYKPGADAETTSQRGTGVLCVELSEKATIPYTAGRTTMIGVGKNTRYPEKAVKVIELVNTDKELYNLICFGIEGKHYTLAEDGITVNVIEGAGYNPGSSWRFGNVFNALLLPGQDADVWKQTEEFNNTAEASPILGFNFDNMSVRTEIAQLETVFGKYTSFEKGFLELDSYYDEFVKEVEKAGVQKVIDEVNKQLEEFFATK